MATDQGKMGNIIGLALMAEALNCSISEVGVPVFALPTHQFHLGHWQEGIDSLILNLSGEHPLIIFLSKIRV